MLHPYSPQEMNKPIWKMIGSMTDTMMMIEMLGQIHLAYAPAPVHDEMITMMIAEFQNQKKDDLQDLFERIAPVDSAKLMFDRAGRSTGTAYVVYPYVADARKAIREFDGANAKGQPIRLELLPPTAPAAGRSEPRTRRDNPFDRVENPRSLFDRVEAPKGRERRARSASPGEDRGYSGRRNGGGTGPASRDRRSDISRPAPEGIDRYVPGRDDSRSSSRRAYGGREGGGRRPGERRERGERAGKDGRDGEGHRLVNGRPRKTQEELDAEMEDYWGNAGNADGAAPTNGAANPAASAAPAVQVTAAGDDDIDMIE
ncbi:hypothetical protein EPUS_07563 [Endocarpon pusillum Z07020]|uniref:RRM domain-containing protein n=1 Tax=Endocarpon pusillum (strain Z07020 / HMAS-L-300199) TaxID=1263415 RepID=U1FXW4_ENDPU|nr:uncharacterized protein EPUS_07563 [Endocarpon pusillum Z07020]ERF69737.1 hypothetical protein EPUS_07563 [Endocarpon pusillum Z07020]